MRLSEALQTDVIDIITHIFITGIIHIITDIIVTEIIVTDIIVTDIIETDFFFLCSFYRNIRGYVHAYIYICTLKHTIYGVHEKSHVVDMDIFTTYIKRACIFS
jgi:hypothetical protein